LSGDFSRFQERMNKLATHIDQANRDVDEVNISARKISNRFNKIERVELEGEDAGALETQEDDSE
jgi:DNA recombination protein RmuC